MKKFSAFAAGIILLLFSSASLCLAQQVTQTTVPVQDHGVINFTELAKQELLNPPPVVFRDVEADEDAKLPFNRYLPVPPGAPVTKVTVPETNIRVQSPAPSISFGGAGSAGLFPPDVQAAAGPSHVMETINGTYRINTKTGSLVSSVGWSTFWSGVSSNSVLSDPRIQYDAANQRWVACLIGVVNSNGHYSMLVAVSQTSDPTGSWFEYSFDTGSGSNLTDFPSLGYNTNWVVIAVNYFVGGVTWNSEKIYMFNRASLYSGTLGSVVTATDASGAFTICPAQTQDASQTTEYLLCDFNGNSGGNGFVRLSTITGTASSPTYAIGSTIGVNQPWSESAIDAKQKGTSTKIETDDTRMSSVIYRNGSLWGAHHVYLPSSSPTRVSADVWQINPSTLAVQQFIRIDDPSGNNQFYYPSLSVDNSGNALIGYTFSGTNDFASGAYSFHAASDAAGTIEDPFIYKAGLGIYTVNAGGRIRWGDYSETAIDPADGSFWTCQEYAIATNNYSTYYANVIAPGGSSCGIPGGLAASNITTSSATLSWNAVTGAVSYNVQYRPTGTSTWTSTSSSTTSVDISGLLSITQYEFQVQTVCSASSSAFSSSALFTTGGGCSDAFEPNNSKGKAASIPVNTDEQAEIASSTDKDWYKFSNTAGSPNIKVTLTNLPQDYDIFLYNPSGTLVGKSKNGTTLDEQIIFNGGPVGTYDIKVIGFNGAFSTTSCYTLNASISSSPFKLGADALTASNPDSKSIRIYPNPSSGDMTIEYIAPEASTVELNLYDMTGKLAYTTKANAVEGSNQFNINPDRLMNGLYIIEVKDDGNVERSRVMVQK